MKKFYYFMIVVNPRNHWTKSGHFWDAVWDFHNFALCNFFPVLFSGELTVESERSPKVILHEVTLVF